MCGVAGIVRLDDAPIDPRRADGMLSVMANRGPDDRRTASFPRCLLAHARLSILDAAGGVQPMIGGGHAGQPGSAVVFNGEIYNHRELRRELESKGYAFKSDHSDTEVLLHGHAAWGRSLPAHLEGMFAFAVWDAQAGSLTLTRDRFGEKPLYFWRSPDGLEIVFASTVAAVCAGMPAGAARDISRPALVDYLRFGYVIGATLVAGVEEVAPRSTLTFDATGAMTRDVYWVPPPREISGRANIQDAMRAALEQAVEARLESDVPLGCLLSGGVDSSLVTALAQHAMLRRGAKPMRTFTVRMPDDAYDESPYARRVAAHLGTKHTELIPEPGRGMLGDLEYILSQSGEPTGDSSILPTYWLSRAMREHVTVGLSGDGGDELFGGYDRYTAIRLLMRHKRWLARLPFSGHADGPQRSLMTRVGRLARAARCGTIAEAYHGLVSLFSEEQIRALGVEPSDARAACASADGGAGEGVHSVADAMRRDMDHYLPGDLLHKVDRASMSVALEIRAPLLDTAVANLALSAPMHQLMPNGKRKGLLRHIAAPLLPKGLVDRRKRGFAVPIGGWMRTSLKEGVASRLFDGPLTNLGLKREAIGTLWREHLSEQRDHTHRLFALISLSSWLAKR